MVELISVHVPKCAGTSMRAGLERAYGPASIYVDRESSPANPSSPAHLDPIGYRDRFRQHGYPFLEGKRAVHGHFHLGKYDFVADRCLRVTFLRHPVSRATSHFRFWRQTKRHGQPLHNYMIDHDLDVLGFARLPIIQYFYTRTFFAGIDRSRFDFVGAFETIDRDLPRLAQMIGMPLSLKRQNVTPEAEPAVETPEILAQLEEILAEDIALYRA